MTLRFRAVLLAIASVLYLGACGETFRPIATPITSGGGDPQVKRHAIVVSNNGPAADGSATHVNISGDTNVGQVPLGQDPVHAGLASGGAVVFIANRASASGKASVTGYSVFDQPTSPNLPLVTSLPDNSSPSYVFSTGGVTVYVALSGLNTVGVLTLGQAGLQTQIPVGTSPVAMGALPNAARLYVANQGSNDVSVVQTADNTVVTTVPVGTQPSFIVTSADNKFVYVVNKGSGTVTVINAETNAVAGTPAVGASPVYAAFDAKNLRVYIANSGTNTITSINADSNSANFLATSTITVGAGPVSLTPLTDGSRIYVANSGSNSISVVNALSLTVQNTLTVPVTAGALLKPVSIASSTDSTKVVVAFQDTAAVTATDADESAIVTIRTSDHTLTNIPTPTSPSACVSATPGWCRMKPVFVVVTP
ncbi:MAG TPA: YncE family protein [Terriglobales bacterium]|nr:YncE family protein [Terriglobales bacterium]